LPPSWDQFTDPYIAGQLDEEMMDPKKLISSQEFIGIICQEAECQNLHATGTIMFPDQLALIQSGKKSRLKPPLASWISRLITDAPQSGNPSSSSKKKCKYCNHDGHLVSKCCFLNKPKCQYCGKIGHESNRCWKKHGKRSNEQNEDNNNGNNNKKSKKSANNVSADNTIQVNGAELGESVILTDEVVASRSAYADESYITTLYNMYDDTSIEFDQGHMYDWMANSGASSHITH
jgi:hypothetical protein